MSWMSSGELGRAADEDIVPAVWDLHANQSVPRKYHVWRPIDDTRQLDCVAEFWSLCWVGLCLNVVRPLNFASRQYSPATNSGNNWWQIRMMTLATEAVPKQSTSMLIFVTSQRRQLSVSLTLKQGSSIYFCEKYGQGYIILSQHVRFVINMITLGFIHFSN